MHNCWAAVCPPGRAGGHFSPRHGRTRHAVHWPSSSTSRSSTSRPPEGDVNHRYVTPDNRRRLADVLHGANLRLVASGHVHQHRLRRVADVDHCWAPSTAYVLPERKQPLLGSKRVGYFAYTFRRTAVDVDIIETPELTNHDLDDFPLAALSAVAQQRRSGAPADLEPVGDLVGVAIAVLTGL